MHPEEAAFQAALDENPADHTTRLVFADWLQERGDPRAEGYRALATLRKVPGIWAEFGYDGYWFWLYGENIETLPADWWNRFREKYSLVSALRPSRRECEDWAARAFSELPATRRAELLNSTPTTA